MGLFGLVVSVIFAQYVGVSSFAALSPNFPCDAFLATSDFSARPAMVVLPGTFGDDWTCVSRFADRYHDKDHLLEFHLDDETCRRNHNCLEGSLVPWLSVKDYGLAIERRDSTVLAAIRDRVKNLRAIAEVVRNPNTYLVLSTGLEDNYSSAAFVVLVEELQKEWPYLIVRSGSKFFGFPREQHGLNAQCSGTTIVANVDGGRGRLSQERKFLKRNASKCLVTFLWRAEHQGRGRNNKWSPPMGRIFVWTAKDVVEMGSMLWETTR